MHSNPQDLLATPNLGELKPGLTFVQSEVEGLGLDGDQAVPSPSAAVKV